MRCVTGVRIHHQLGVRKVLRQDQPVNWLDNDVLVAVNNQSGLRDLLEHLVAPRFRHLAPFLKSFNLRHRGDVSCRNIPILVRDQVVRRARVPRFGSLGTE